MSTYDCVSTKKINLIISAYLMKRLIKEDRGWGKQGKKENQIKLHWNLKKKVSIETFLKRYLYKTGNISNSVGSGEALWTLQFSFSIISNVFFSKMDIDFYFRNIDNVFNPVHSETLWLPEPIA